jgi:hypothetical protein
LNKRWQPTELQRLEQLLGQRITYAEIAWVRNVVEQCRGAGVPAFVKQLGARPIDREVGGAAFMVQLADKKGGDMEEWPDDLRVREMPTP